MAYDKSNLELDSSIGASSIAVRVNIGAYVSQRPWGLRLFRSADISEINALKLLVRNNWKTIYGSISVNSLDKPRPDEIRVGDKVKGGLCVVRSRSKLVISIILCDRKRDFHHDDDNGETSMRPAIRNPNGARYKTFRFDDHSFVRSPRGRSRPPTIHHRHDATIAKEKSRGGSMVSLIRSARRGSVAHSIRPIEHALDQDDLRSHPAYTRSLR
ncbi:hypothetical protein G5I_04731 [Acromyrmex echinatior]|uniref:Uncharacterized protein n=1 Tax=Acromyrmex echinatior TaxID=103372 RepID=F4WGF6_ACREC|nr:hypothetical protein G5I_04731 [Acromyrmex echinatior]